MPSILDPEITRQTLAGYAVVNQIVERERRARLQTMTDEEARALFDDLCATWERLGKDGGDWDRVDHRRLQHKLQVRRVLVQLARQSGLD